MVFDAEAAAPYVFVKSDDGRMLTFSAYEGSLILRGKLPKINDGVVKSVDLREVAGRTSVVIYLDLAAGAVKDFVLSGPDRIVLDITRGAAEPSEPVRPDVKRTIVVIDPGHGGRDTGIVTARGQEKSRTLMLAKLLKKMISKEHPEMNVMLTRGKNTYRSLDERAAMANSAAADIFLSLHASTGRDVRVYILELDTASIPRRSAQRRDFLGFEAAREQQEQLWGTQQYEHAQASSVLGRKLMEQLTGSEERGPVQAPLKLLKPVDAAAVLIEVGMDRNRTTVARAIVRGIGHYVREVQ